MKKEELRPVKYKKVKKALEGGKNTYTGVVQADIESNLSFKVGGTIKAIKVKVGQSVDKDQLVAQLDPEPYQIKLAEVNAKVMETRASARNAAANYIRFRSLFKDGAISESQLDDARANADASRNKMDSAERSYDYAKLQLSYTSLYAPQDGFITSFDKEVGENVSPGQKVFGFVSKLRNEVKVFVPESAIPSIDKDIEVDINIDAIPGKKFTGTIYEVGVATNEDAVTFPVIIRIKNDPEELRPGMTADVTFTKTKNRKPTIIVPISAISEDNNGKYVFVIKDIEGDIGVTSKEKLK